jgi:hypothetical protein
MTGVELAPLVAIIGAVTLINLGFAWLLARSNRSPADLFGSAGAPAEQAAAAVERTTADSPPLAVDGETVVCRHCGAANRPAYRYCRWCVRSGFADDAGGGPADGPMVNRSL